MADKGQCETEEHSETRREAIHAVDKVDDVGHSHEPCDRHWEAPPSEIEVLRPQGIRNGVNGDAHKVENGASCDLTEQLHLCTLRFYVVDEADGEDEAVRNDHGLPPCEEAGKAYFHEEKARCQRHEYGKPAEARDGLFMLLSPMI